MEQKYRVNELAKDLNVSTGEITELVQEYFGVQKKAQASLSEEELSVVLEKYSQKNQDTVVLKTVSHILLTC